MTASTPTIEIPELTTPRLLMRSFRDSDIGAYAEMMSDELVARYIGDGNTLTRPDAWRQMALFAGHWVLRGYGIWAVEERETGTFPGTHRILGTARLARLRARLHTCSAFLGSRVRTRSRRRSARLWPRNAPQRRTSSVSFAQRTLHRFAWQSHSAPGKKPLSS
jgi:hypothetical protein